MQPHNASLVLLSLEKLCDLEEKHLNTHGSIYDTNNHLMSMLWKVGGEGNPVKGSQAPLLSDVSLEMHCLQVLHHALTNANMYRMDDKPEKMKFVDRDWEVTIADVVDDMGGEYSRMGMNIPESIIAKLSSFHMSLGRAAHTNYTIIDDLVSEAIHCL